MKSFFAYAKNQLEQMTVKEWSLSIYFGIVLLMLFNPNAVKNNTVSSFDRVFGEGVAANWDCSRLINNFGCWFLFFVLSILTIGLFVKYIKDHCVNKNNMEAWKKLDILIPVGYITIFFHGLTFFRDYEQKLFDFSCNLISAVIFFHVLYCAVKLNKHISYEAFYIFMASMLGVSFVCSVFLPCAWSQGKYFFIVYFMVLIVFFIIVFCLGRKKAINTEFSEYFMVGFSCVFFLTSVYLELINILNQYCIYINTPKLWYAIAIFLLAFFSIIFALILCKKKTKINLKNVLHFSILLGISSLSVNIPLISKGAYSINESANFGVLISDFLNYKRIPIVEHYGGHMLMQFMGGVTYGIINQDYGNAVYSPYSVYIYVLILMLSYFFLRSVLDEDWAFWITLVTPIYLGLNYWGIGLIVCICLKKYIESPQIFHAVIMWLCSVLVLLYRLDIGTAFLFGLIIALILRMAIIRQWNDLKKLLFSGIIVAASFFTAFFCICFAKGIQPISRIKEFIYISASNLNWARNSIGNVSTNVFIWNYLILPVCCITIMLLIIFSKKIQEKMSVYVLTLELLLGTAYLINFSRGLVRHSMVEVTLEITTFTAYIFISIFLWRLSEKKYVFTVAFFCILFLDAVFDSVIVTTEKGMITKAECNMDIFFDSWKDLSDKDIVYANGTEQIVDWSNLNEKVSRVSMQSDLKNKAVPLKTIMEIIGCEEDTWIDFVNYTFLYAVNGYECPVYVSQSPMQLSGELTQEAFIEELENNREHLPIALLPNTGVSGYGFDGIHNNYRHYKVAEYLFRNYRPLCEYQNEVAIWCRNDIYDQAVIDILNYNRACELLNDLCYENPTYISITSNVDVSDAFNVSMLSYGTYELTLSCNAQEAAELKLYYTDSSGETFSENKMQTAAVQYGSGTVTFAIPVNKYTRIQLEICGENPIVVDTFKWNKKYDYFELLDWTYDNPILSSQHVYTLGFLPYIWANFDEKEASSNVVLSEAAPVGGSQYHMEPIMKEDRLNGNYLMIECNYSGKEQLDDKTAVGYIKLYGEANEEMIYYTYSFNLMEGINKYIIRVSADSYWSQCDITNIMFWTGSGEICDVNMKLLAGD